MRSMKYVCQAVGKLYGTAPLGLVLCCGLQDVPHLHGLSVRQVFWQEGRNACAGLALCCTREGLGYVCMANPLHLLLPVRTAQSCMLVACIALMVTYAACLNSSAPARPATGTSVATPLHRQCRLPARPCTWVIAHPPAARAQDPLEHSPRVGTHSR